MIGGISGWQLLILLLIVVLVFGTKRLRNIGSDLGGAVKGFKRGMEDDGESESEQDPSAERLAADPEPGPDAGTSDEKEKTTTRSSGSQA